MGRTRITLDWVSRTLASEAVATSSASMASGMLKDGSGIRFTQVMPGRAELSVFKGIGKSLNLQAAPGSSGYDYH